MMALVTTNNHSRKPNGVIPTHPSHNNVQDSCEQQSQFIQKRISNVEKHFGALCSVLAGYTRKTARLRDKGDELSKSLASYAQSETLNHTCKAAIVKYAENLATLQDFRNVEVNRLEAKVLGPLTEYGATCKKTREDLNKAFDAQAKEKKSQKNLESIREKRANDRSGITKAQQELEMATVNTLRLTKAVEEQMDAFERRKLSDLKQILQEFVNVEMAFHAKALERLTQCHKSLSIINEDEDIEEFRNSLRPLSSSTRSRGMARSSSRTSLNSAGGSERSNPATPKRRSKPPIQPKTPNHHTPNNIRSVGNHVSSRPNGRHNHSNAKPVAPPRDQDDDDDEYSDLTDEDEEESLEDQPRNEYYKYNHR